MGSDEWDESLGLKVRTKVFALRVIRLYKAIPRSGVGDVIGKQVLRSATSVGAQYREGLRARSDAEVVNKWSGALRELEESAYWFELLVESETIPEARMASLIQECEELLAMLTASINTIKARSRA